jgi:hypothetical protein
MSLLINETYANKEAPLWLDTNLTSTQSLNVVTLNTGFQVMIPNGTLKLGTITFTTPVNYAKLNGWIAIQNSTGSPNTQLNGCSIYLTSGIETTWSNTKGTQLSGLNITTGSPSAETYALLDNLVYFNNTPFTVLNLYLSNQTANSSGLRCLNAYASNTYSALPTISGWTASLGGGSLMVTAGLV